MHEEREQLKRVEIRANQLRDELNLLSFKAEEKQQQLERLAQAEANLKLNPEMPTTPIGGKHGLKGSGSTTSAVNPSSPPELHAARDGARSPTAASSIGESQQLSTLSQLLGDHHPTVALEHSRLAVEMRLAGIEPQLNEAEEYGETLTMMLFRLRQQHALLLADIGERRDKGTELQHESHELKLLAGEARGAANVARRAAKEAAVARQKNAATYRAKLAERQREIEVQSKRQMKQDRIAAASRESAAASSKGAIRLSTRKGASDAELPAEQQERLQRVLVASRMSSLVLLAQRDDNVEQVSRYEAAFKKMARAAGSNDAEVVIAKFIARNETRAGLLDERGQAMRRRAGLDAELQRLTTQVQEMQYSMVHPAQTESALRKLEPKLTKAAGRLNFLTTQCQRLGSLQLAAGSGCHALLSRLAASVPSLGASPEDELGVEHPSSGGGEGERLGGGNADAENADALSAAAAAAAGTGGGTGVGVVSPSAEAVEWEGASALFGEKLLSMVKSCEQRLERLVQKVGEDKVLAGATLSSRVASTVASTQGSLVASPTRRRSAEHVTGTDEWRRRRGSSESIEEDSMIGGMPGAAPTPLLGASFRRGPGGTKMSARPKSAGGVVGLDVTALESSRGVFNIRVGPDGGPVEALPPSQPTTPRGMLKSPHGARGGSAAASGRQACALSAQRPSTALVSSGGGGLGGGLGDGLLTPGMGVAPVDASAEDADEEAERVGYFGEERRRVKVGERPASARKAHERSPVPPPGGTSLGAREGLFGGGGGPRGRKMAKAGAPPPGAPGGRPSNGSSKRGSVSAR